MKQFDDSFDALYELNDTDLEIGSDRVKTMTTYQNVLKKAGLERRRGWKRSSKVLLVAAVLATATLTVAAAVYGVSDAFRGVLPVHDSAQGSSGSEAVLDRTGSVISESTKSGDVQVSLRAAVGDERYLQVLVDVVDTSGKALAITQQDGSLSDGFFALSDYSMTKANGDALYGSTGYKVIDPDPTDDKLTILFDYMIAGDRIGNEPLKLHFEDIQQYTVLTAKTLTMEPDTLYEIVAGYEEYGEADFRLSDYDDGAGRGYLLDSQRTGESTPISKEYSGVVITNATVKDKSLYLQGTYSSKTQAEQVLDHPVLGNAATGQSISASVVSMDTDHNKWSVRFDGPDSMDALKGFVWNYGAGESVHTAYEGSWDFTFQVDMEDMSVKVNPALKTEWEGHSMTVTALEISPYSLFLQYDTDEATAQKMFPETEWGTLQSSAWIDSDHPITLTMKDGSTIAVNGGSMAPKGGNLIAAAPGTTLTEYEMHFSMDTVIDPGQISTVQIGNQTLTLGQ